jgi:hypothetical protein
MSTTLRCKYRCPGCKCDEEFIGPARESPNDDVVAYVQRLARVAGLDHMTKHPECLHRRVDLMIPVPPKDDPDPWIGKAHEQPEVLPAIPEASDDANT